MTVAARGDARTVLRVRAYPGSVREERILCPGTDGGKAPRRRIRPSPAFALVLVLVAVTSLAVAGLGAAGSLATTALTVIYREDGSPTTRATRWMVRCNPARGTLPHPGIACRRLAAGGAKLFAPVPKNVACTEIYGGQQTALVTGVVAGTRVWARFSRVDGCQIDRWRHLSPWLLPLGGAS
jgi:hypothetical protein